MTLETDADRLAMLDEDDHGTTATYTPDGGSASTINGIFDNEFFEAVSEGVIAVEGSQPRFICRTIDAPIAGTGDTLVVPVGGTSYDVVGVEPDGTGMTTLLLAES